jgi:hypothetical protein
VSVFTHVDIQGMKMLILTGDLCSVGAINTIGVISGVQRQRTALLSPTE